MADGGELTLLGAAIVAIVAIVKAIQFLSNTKLLGGNGNRPTNGAREAVGIEQLVLLREIRDILRDSQADHRMMMMRLDDIHKELKQP